MQKIRVVLPEIKLVGLKTRTNNQKILRSGLSCELRRVMLKFIFVGQCNVS